MSVSQFEIFLNIGNNKRSLKNAVDDSETSLDWNNEQGFAFSILNEKDLNKSINMIAKILESDPLEKLVQAKWKELSTETDRINFKKDFINFLKANNKKLKKELESVEAFYPLREKLEKGALNPSDSSDIKATIDFLNQPDIPIKFKQEYLIKNAAKIQPIVALIKTRESNNQPLLNLLNGLENSPPNDPIKNMKDGGAYYDAQNLKTAQDKVKTGSNLFAIAESGMQSPKHFVIYKPDPNSSMVTMTPCEIVGNKFQFKIGSETVKASSIEEMNAIIKKLHSSTLTAALIKSMKDGGAYYDAQNLKTAQDKVKTGSNLFAIAESGMQSPKHFVIYKPDPNSSMVTMTPCEIVDNKFQFKIGSETVKASSIEEMNAIIKKLHSPESGPSLEGEADKYIAQTTKIIKQLKAAQVQGGLPEDYRKFLKNLSELMEKHSAEPDSADKARKFLNDLIALHPNEKTQAILTKQVKTAQEDAIILLAKDLHGKLNDMYTKNKQRIDSALSPKSTSERLTSLTADLNARKKTPEGPESPTMLTGTRTQPQPEVEPPHLTRTNTNLKDFKDNLVKEIDAHNKEVKKYNKDEANKDKPKKQPIEWSFKPNSVTKDTPKFEVFDKDKKPVFTAEQTDKDIVVKMAPGKLNPDSALLAMRAMGDPIEVNSKSQKDLLQIAELAAKEGRTLQLSPATLAHIKDNPAFNNFRNKYPELCNAPEPQKNKPNMPQM